MPYHLRDGRLSLLFTEFFLQFFEVCPVLLLQPFEELALWRGEGSNFFLVRVRHCRDKGQRFPFESRRQHEGHGIEKRGQIVVTYPSGQVYLGRREKRTGLNNVNDVSGLCHGRGGGQRHDDALESALAEGDPYRLPHLDVQMRGYGIAESAALGNRGINTDLSIFHTVLHRLPRSLRFPVGG